MRSTAPWRSQQEAYVLELYVWITSEYKLRLDNLARDIDRDKIINCGAGPIKSKQVTGPSQNKTAHHAQQAVHTTTLVHSMKLFSDQKALYNMKINQVVITCALSSFTLNIQSGGICSSTKSLPKANTTISVQPQSPDTQQQRAEAARRLSAHHFARPTKRHGVPTQQHTSPR